MVSLRTRRKSARQSPLLLLPKELIEMIILHVVELQFSREQHLEDLTRISLVCSRLHNVIKNNPRFWAYIIPQSVLQTKTQLQKSSNCPLQIFAIDESRSLLELLCSQIHRWQHVRLQQPPKKLDILRHPAPLLESFSLGSGSLQLTPDLFQGHAPKLRKLDIEEYHMPWDSGLLRGLTYLRICLWDPRTKAMPTSEQYLNVLTGCPNLEELHLHGCHFWNPLPPADGLKADVQLRYLAKLSLIALQAGMVQSFLFHIKASTGLASLDITIPSSNNRDYTRTWFQKALKGVLINSFMKRVLLNPGEVEIEQSILSQYKIASSGELKLNIALRDDSITSIHELLPQSSYRSITALTYYSGVGLYSRWLLSHLPHLQNLVHLELHAESESKRDEDRTVVLTLLKSLSSPISESAPYGCRWLCPRLEELFLTRLRVKCEDLAPFVQARLKGHQGSSSTSPSDGFALPARLRKLIINAHSDIPGRYLPSSKASNEAASKIAENMGRGFIWNNRYFDLSEGWQYNGSWLNDT